MPARAVIERNTRRKADPAFNITGSSTPTGIHYSWDWSVGPSCTIHFVHMNLFPGHSCGSPGNPGREGAAGTGFPCTDAWTWAEASLDFLETDLAANAGPGKMVVTIQHCEGFAQKYRVDGAAVCLTPFSTTHNPRRRARWLV